MDEKDQDNGLEFFIGLKWAILISLGLWVLIYFIIKTIF